jgi:DNA-binding NarL/FixJ family response regulator
MEAVVNIYLVENNFLLRSGLEGLILEIPGLLLKEVFEGNEKNLFEKLTDKKPDAIIIDPDSVGDNFINLISKLQDENDIKLIGITRESCPENICSRFKYQLPFEANKHVLLKNLREACGSDALLIKNKQGPLSKREIVILKEVVKGLTNQEVADKLFLSIHTVMTHRKNITKKLGIKTVSGLMVYALMNNIIDINEVG